MGTLIATLANNAFKTSVGTEPAGTIGNVLAFKSVGGAIAFLCASKSYIKLSR